jgi:transposase
MKHYVGLDVSQATTAICLVDGEGRTLAEGVRATEPCANAAFVRQASSGSGIERIGMEAGPLSIWLWNELRALELPVVCMDARHGDAGLPGPA